VAHGGLDSIAARQIIADRPSFGGGFDNNQG
jgi:hypothetical protein